MKLIITLLTLDIWSKILVEKYFPNIVVYNTGVTLSLLKGQTQKITFVTYIIVAGILMYYKQITNLIDNDIAVNMVIAGIIGNLLDRIYHGHVIDWINMGYWVGNIADILIVLGFTCILVSLAWKELNKK